VRARVFTIHVECDNTDDTGEYADLSYTLPAELSDSAIILSAVRPSGGGMNITWWERV
jgi:hypothetical protein